MKKIIPILMLVFFSTTLNAQNNYDDLWKEVEKFERDNLPKSALKVVEDIYAKAEKSNNSPQIVKCLFYKSKFSLTLEEDAQLKIVNQFKEHIAKRSFPTKNVLENILANLYWQYFQQNRWQFYGRTQTQNKVDTNDFRTWDLNTLFAEIHTYFENSLDDKTQLQKVDIREFKDILHTAEDSQKYRPSLYDFLAHNALIFYKTTETNITKPAYQFKLKNEDLLSDAKSFSKLNLTTKDTLSLQFNALKIYQNLIEFHLNENNTNALVDTDIQRLQFVNQHGTFANKEQLYLKTLERSKKQYENNETSGLYAYEIANIYSQKATKNNEKLQFKKREALEICEKISKRFPDSYGAKKCAFLKQQILSKSLNLTTEEFLPVKKNGRVLVNYKNTDKLFFTIFKADKKQRKYLQKLFREERKVQFINNLSKVTSWTSTLKNKNDYLEHSTEIVSPKLPQGDYLIVASLNEKINKDEVYGYTDIQVTDLVFIKNTVNGNAIYQVLNRNTGNPIPKATVHLKNNPFGRHYAKLDKKFTTDKNGEFSYNSENYYGDIQAFVSHKDQKAIFDNIYINKYYKPQPEDLSIYTNTFLFTDRAIYRPGQIAYFKGIATSKQDKKSTVLVNHPVEVTLIDANYQEVKKITLTTNEFGSFSSEFVIPNTGLTGQFTIQTKIGSSKDRTYFSVEEYKRPKFETEFKPITKSYKINDEITLNGFAKAFSGAKISDAKVVYRVHRKVQYPRWWYWYRPSFSSEQQEIKNGELTTDENGNFNIVFKALADESVSKKGNPIFTYKVTADVTDINGETRSATTEVKVGYHSLVATISVDETLNKADKNQTLKVDTKNLNGEFVSAKGTIKIYKLIPPAYPLRKRPWQAPDYQTISEKEFKKMFPHDAFKNEDNFANWQKGILVFNSDFNTDKEKEIKLTQLKNWKSGKYVVELDSQDKFNQKVTDKTYFSLISNKDKLPTDNQLISIKTDKNSYKVGEKATITISTNSSNITVMLFIEKKHQVVEKKYIHLNKNSKKISIPVEKDDVGGFGFSYYFVNYNSFESGNRTIKVPYPKTELEIITKTFRDKLQPGENQTWSFTIKGAKKDKVFAEMLASMYDMSLDEFVNHEWKFNPLYQPIYSSYDNANANTSFGTEYFRIENFQNRHDNFSHIGLQYDQLNWFGFYFGNGHRRRLSKALQGKAAGLRIRGSSSIKKEVITADSERKLYSSKNKELYDQQTDWTPENSTDELKVGLGYTGDTTNQEKQKSSTDGIQIRKNLQETAFFYPHLTTDKNGNVTFNFTVPEALTKWKLQLLAHTKELHSATEALETVTQKELMVIPNAPRFLREGDKITLSSKISNLSNRNLQGTAQLLLTDAVTGKDINLFDNSTKNQSFSVDKDGNTNVSWNLSIPDNVNAVQYKVIAKAGDFSDGEQNALPVLTNRTLVTETVPMWVRRNQTKTFTLDKLKNNNSTSLKHHKLTLEVTSNPAWYAVQALPYLMEYPYECSEQTFARYYANTLASHIANSNPRIQEVFNSWKSSDALLSNLDKNQELKSLIIQETPWLRDAQSETEQKKRIALLFDLNKMKNEQQNAINKLAQMQLSGGGFPWFKGGYYPSAYITQYIASGFGHLKQLGVADFNNTTRQIIKKSVQFLDSELAYHYQKLLNRAEEVKAREGQQKYEEYLAKKHIGYFEVQYIYMRSFYRDISIPSKTKKAVEFYKKQSANYWNDFNLYGKGLIALAQFRTGDKTISSKILNSLRENSITSEELGMYWKSNTAGYYNYQAPIETQALLIEAFSEIENDTKTIDNLKIWLLKNKQVARWKTTKATSEAVYALLLQGSDWISTTELVDVKLSDIQIDPTKIPEVQVEAGTGYFKTSWNGHEVTPKMSEVTLTSKGKTIAWGGLYWQYFEDLDKITSAETPLKLKKKLFKKVNSDTGKKLIEVTDNSTLKVGDLLTVRIELRADRAMEFIHMKDMRASGVEPINVLSQYKWQDGLGYYESTKDASTNFFFDRLPKGVYVFEYDVRVNNAGNFSNGITTIESMYAPEFKSHSEGVRIKVE